MHPFRRSRPRAAASIAAVLLLTTGLSGLAGCGGDKVDDATRQGAVSLQSAMGSASRGIDNVRPTRSSLDNLASTLRDASDQTTDVLAVLTGKPDDQAASLLADAARKQRSFLQNAQAAASDHSRSAALAAVSKASSAGQEAADAYGAVTREFSELAGVVPATTTFATGRLRDAISTAMKPGTTTKKKSDSGTATKGSTSGSASSGMTDCGGGISAGASTSCPFARNVASTFSESGGSDVIEVWSPVTERYYTMTCSGAMPTVCTGGNGARVEIR